MKLITNIGATDGILFIDYEDEPVAICVDTTDGSVLFAVEIPEHGLFTGCLPSEAVTGFSLKPEHEPATGKILVIQWKASSGNDISVELGIWKQDVTIIEAWVNEANRKRPQPALTPALATSTPR
jgi:hypothetical protein